ncbi:MAG: hypothetical protein IAE93_05985 [Ignavibacteria bacterium]|nr:hypothetical protein [Ignavibacteria bacterium]
MMNTELFLPDKNWSKGMKSLIFTPTIFSVIAGAGILGVFTGPFGLFFALSGGGLLYYLVLALIIELLIKYNRDKKIKAILEVYEKRYTEMDLKQMYKDNRKELNRLYKLASDEFFRKYIEEQANHKKAQELIVMLQKSINDMKLKLDKLLEKEEKHKKEIDELNNEINEYEDILKSWNEIGAKACLTN